MMMYERLVLYGVKGVTADAKELTADRCSMPVLAALTADSEVVVLEVA